MRRFNTLSVIKLLTLPNSHRRQFAIEKFRYFGGFCDFYRGAERNAEAVKMGKPKSAIGSGATEDRRGTELRSALWDLPCRRGLISGGLVCARQNGTRKIPDSRPFPIGRRAAGGGFRGTRRLLTIGSPCARSAREGRQQQAHWQTERASAVGFRGYPGLHRARRRQ